MKSTRTWFRKQLRKRIRSGCHWRKNIQLLVFSVMVAVASFGGLYTYTHYVSTIAHGVVMWGEDFSGETRASAELMLSDMIADWESQQVEVVVQREDQEPSIEMVSVGELGFVYHVEATVERLFEQSLLAADLLDVHGSAMEVEPAVQLQDAVLEALLRRIVSYEETPQSAQVVLDEEEGQWVFREHELGYGLSGDEQLSLAQQIRDLAIEAPAEPTLEVSLEQVVPAVLSAELEEIYSRIESLLAREVTWPVDGYVVKFSPRDYPWIIEVDGQGIVSVSEAALADYVADWASVFDREPSTVRVGEEQVQTSPIGEFLKAPFEGVFEDGRVLNQERMVQQLLEALQGEESQVSIELEHEQESPVVLTVDGQELTLLSQGRSSYKLGNGEDRVYNVQFGLDKYDGLVIPPGAEFSFNDVLGWVTYEGGWKPALAIFGGGGVRKVPGGGLCQVSTTVYRAAIHSGLPITKRKPHSLDVSYYHAYGDGIDATIYPPADVDLKFVNDTPGPIVVHTYTDNAREEAFVEFYGVDDGRSIELEQIENRPVVLPKQVSYDPDLPVGKEVIDRIGTVGRYVEWDWKVIREDGSVDQRYIETLYPGAPKKTRVGTGA